MPGLFGNGIDNSKLTPEYNGQGEQGATDNNNQGQTEDIIENQNGAPQVDGQAQGGEDNNEGGYQIGEQHFDSIEDVISAYESMQKETEQLQKNYKNLQSDYTKKSQRLSMMNKMGNVQNQNIAVQQPIQPARPYGQGVQVPDFNTYMFGRDFQAQPNMGYTPQARPVSQPTVDPAVIQMAADQKIAELRLQDQNFDEVSPVLWDIIETDPYFLNVKFTDIEMTKNTINLAYQMAKDRVNQAKANININNARKEAYISKQQKVINNDNSNVATQNNARQQNKKTAEDIIKDSIKGAKPQIF